MRYPIEGEKMNEKKGKEKKEGMKPKKEIWQKTFNTIMQDQEKIIEQTKLAKAQFPELTRAFVLFLSYSHHRHTRLRGKIIPKGQAKKMADPKKKEKANTVIKWLTKRLKETEDEEITMELNEALKTWGAVASIDYPILTDISDDFEPLAINYSNVFKSLFGEESLEHRCLEGDMLAIEELASKK